MENDASSQVCSPFNSLSVIQFRGQEPVDQDSDEYSKALHDLGVGEVDRIPVLSFAFKNLELLRQQLLDTTFDGLILTSPRAVEAVQKSLADGSGMDSIKEVWRNRHIFCVGPKTAKELYSQLGLQVSLDPEFIGDGHKLGAQILSFLREKNLNCKLLLPCSTIAKMYSVDQLTSAGHEVVINFVYETIPMPDACDRLKKGVANSIGTNIILVLFSPSNLNAILPELKGLIKEYDMKLVAIGPTTGKAIEDAGIPVWSTCPSPTPEGLINALKEKLS